MCGGGTAGNDNSGTVAGEPTTGGISTSPTSGGRPDPGMSNTPDDGGDNMGVSQGLAQGARNAEQANAAAAAARGYSANGDFDTASAFSGMARDLEDAAALDGYGTTPGRTLDKSNGWGLTFSDRVAYGGMQAGLAPYGRVAEWAGRRMDAFIDNPFASVVDLLLGLMPAANPVLAGVKAGATLMNVGNLFGLTPTAGQALASAAKNGPMQVDPVTGGPVSTPGDPENPFGGAAEGNNWGQIAEGLSETQASTGGSTAPSTVSSTDRRTSYGFSPGQGVDYAELSGGFGGTNVGARSGWRQSANVGGWA